VLVLISTLGQTGSRSRLAFVVTSVTLAVTACSAVAAAPTAPQSYGPFVQQLAREVSDARALTHLQALQKIADEHGSNRATGTPGYDASVEYVVEKTRKQAKAWGGEAGEPYDRCWDEPCDTIDNVNRDVLNHYMRAIAGTLAHFATSA
jgi:Peptidase family M28